MDNLIFTISDSVQKACHVTISKCVAAGGIVFASLAFGETNAVIFTGIMMLCFIDFVTAIVRDKKAGVAIESRKAIRTAIKIAIYGLLVSAGYITESIIGAHFITVPIASTICGFIAVTELISIMENVGRMGYVIPKKLLNLLEDYVKTK